MRTISTLSIDLCRQETPQRICVMQADANTRCVAMRLFADGDAWQVPAGITAAMGYCKPDGTGGLYDKLPDGTDAISIEANCITVMLAPQVLTAHGLVRAVVTLTDADWNQLSTFPFEILVQRNPAAENIVSENYCYYTNLDAINQAIGDVSELTIGTDLVSAINALMDNPNMEQYYQKTETYSREEIDRKISVIPKFSIQVVSSLPVSGISESTIYLLPGGSGSDLYSEYLYVNGKWENLGSQQVDLVDYATEEWVEKNYQPKGNYMRVDDKQELVDAVIAALPAWEGGSY